ncbi:16S rRNA (adenine(1518)-N(6)/adenine(1519)-N(6))-dimethyltransferase RsmA [Ferviditalea candida]|uniref:Ribosomal RNA small subunit methyltransferase A n=1 Tax=Ferviditalea candida TaxID=3108399 RepID=A0ABU5ZIU3_9BACL|nr:16S rRNA (adenine(1518)-N(6)/adenine(1519)-N(6))-dimethyltransferase RsmA [Paenibacillaceae bacterium T2]
MNTLSQGAIGSPKRTKELLQKYGLTLKKSLGQNFLVDRNILLKIVNAAGLDSAKGALEIGPGIGALTQQLAETAGKVAAVEIDQRLIPVLEDVLRPYPNVKIIHGDVLKVNLRAVLADYFSGLQGISVVANLPYYVTTPIVMRLLEERLPFENIVIMIQKEVAERMAAKPGSKDYGSLSVAVQYFSEPELVAQVPRTVFIPQPNVDSTVIRLKLRNEPPIEIEDEDFFFRVVQACFAQRRKTLLNNLLSAFVGKADKQLLLTALDQCGIDPVRRGETLQMHEFAALSGRLREIANAES